MFKPIFALAGAVIIVASIMAFLMFEQSHKLPNVTDNVKSTDNILLTNAGNGDDPFKAIPDSKLPLLYDSGLKVEKIVAGLSEPTSMAFVGSNIVLVTQKGGDVRLIKNGALEKEPLLSFEVNTISERGLLGVAYAKSKVFFYMTEQSGPDIKNRVYSYDLENGTLSGRKIILELPGTPGPNHDGGKMSIGPDGQLYIVIGDLNRNGILQNFKSGGAPDNSSVIMKVGLDETPVASILTGVPGLEGYYAYGIRNSFGLDFDPHTGKLWDTENGPEKYDELNVVEPGFNSGWERIMGPISRAQGESEGNLAMFSGAHYSDPEFSFILPIGITDIEFLNSTKLGNYGYNIFSGDINMGNLYYFVVNEARDALVLEGSLSDRVADSPGEASAITLGTGFGGITDIETGPDGNLYILSFNAGSIYRIVPAVH